MSSLLILCLTAKTHLLVSYAYEAVWPAAVRFVRVDRGWKLLEQDRDAGFLRFELVEDKKPHAATLELVRVTDPEGRPSVRLQLSTEGLARFQEAPILDALGRKLKEELGPPPPPAPVPPKRKEPEARPDAGLISP